MLPTQTIISFKKELTKIAKKNEVIDLPIHYHPEIYGHELGHHRFRQQLGETGHDIYTGAQTLSNIGSNALFASNIYKHITAKEPEEFFRHARFTVPIMTGLNALSDSMRLAEEISASKKSLDLMKGRLSPTDYENAKKRLALLGGTYAVPTAISLANFGANLLARKKHLAYMGGLMMANKFLSHMAPQIGQSLIDKSREYTNENLSTKADIEKLHTEQAPELALYTRDYPVSGVASYWAKPTGKVKEWLTRIGLSLHGMRPKETTDILQRGGIVMGPL